MYGIADGDLIRREQLVQEVIRVAVVAGPAGQEQAVIGTAAYLVQEGDEVHDLDVGLDANRLEVLLHGDGEVAAGRVVATRVGVGQQGDREAARVAGRGEEAPGRGGVIRIAGQMCIVPAHGGRQVRVHGC